MTIRDRIRQNLERLNWRGPSELQEKEMQMLSAMYDFDLIKQNLFDEDIWNVNQNLT